MDVTKQRMGALASRIVALMLNKSISGEMGVHQTHSAPMGLLDVLDALRSIDENAPAASASHSIDLQTVRQVMELMRCDGIGVVDRVVGSETKDRGVQYMASIAGEIHALST